MGYGLCDENKSDSDQDESEVNGNGQGSSSDIDNDTHRSHHARLDTSENSTAVSTVSSLYPPNRVFSREQLEILNILDHPVWVFDIDKRQMRWANQAAVILWNATSLSELLDRDFADMSAATQTRLVRYQRDFSKGQKITDQWTFYPAGVPPTTVQVICSGIRLSVDEVNPSMLVEGMPVSNVDPQMLRGVEMLRHLPMPIAQFDLATCECMYENPQASCMLSVASVGNEESPPPQNPTKEKESNEQDDKRLGQADESESSNAVEQPPKSPGTTAIDFIGRFVDPAVGQDLWKKLQQKEDTIHIEANMCTSKGPKWSAVQLRRSCDPVTAKPVILFSSKDLTDAVRAREEREARIQKSEFLAIMAHEIRTPLHQVTGFTDLLDETSPLNDEQKSFVNLLKSSAKGLMTVINDVLDYSKLEAGKMKLEDIPYEPLSVVEGSLAAVRASCEERSLYLKLDWDAQLPFKVMGDPNRLRQVLLNLLSNAVKFTKEGGIQVRVLHCTNANDPNHPKMKFLIQDTGMGISQDHQDLIFQQYQQGSVTVARTFGGTGLGLSICKLLVQNMGGCIGVHSVEHTGSTFWFSLPAQEPTGLDLMEDTRALDLSYCRNTSLHILVVEDNIVNQKMIAKMLQRMGHTYEVADNGLIAVEKVQQQSSYDAILME